MSDSTTSSAIPTKILVPIDFSPSSHAALDTASDLAEKFHAEIYLLHVIPAFPNVSLPDSITEAAVIDKAKAAAGERFDVSEAVLKGKGIKVTSAVEVSEDVAGTILETVEREGADLIVMLAQCPLLLLRTPKPETSAKVPFGRSMEWW